MKKSSRKRKLSIKRLLIVAVGFLFVLVILNNIVGEKLA